MTEIVITEQDQGKTIETRQNDIITFRIEENLTTGYKWELNAITSNIIELIDSTYIESSGTALGRGGTRVLRFKAISPGTQEIHIRLRRPWDTTDKTLKQLDFIVQVQ